MNDRRGPGTVGAPSGGLLVVTSLSRPSRQVGRGRLVGNAIWNRPPCYGGSCPAVNGLLRDLFACDTACTRRRVDDTRSYRSCSTASQCRMCRQCRQCRHFKPRCLKRGFVTIRGGLLQYPVLWGPGSVDVPARQEMTLHDRSRSCARSSNPSFCDFGVPQGQARGTTFTMRIHQAAPAPAPLEDRCHPNNANVGSNRFFIGTFIRWSSAAKNFHQIG